MSRISPIRRSLRACVGAGVAVLAFAAPAAAAAEPLEQAYVCGIPLAGDQPAVLTSTAQLSTNPNPQFSFSSEVRFGADTMEALSILKAKSIGGKATAKIRLESPGVPTLRWNVPVLVPAVEIPSGAQSLTLKANGMSPAITLPEGVAELHLDGVAFNLDAKNANGEQIVLPPVDDAPRTDEDKYTTDIPCALNAGEPTLLLKTGDVVPPLLPPTGLRVSDLTQTSVRLSWNAVTHPQLQGYQVEVAGRAPISVQGTSVVITGLSPNVSYSAAVRSRSVEGLLTPASSPVAFKYMEPVDPGTALTAGIAGTAKLNTLTKGTVAVTGGLNATATGGDPTFRGDLTLNPTRARLIALGFIPVTADLAFVQSSQTTLTPGAGDVWTSKSSVKIRLPQIYLFGSVPIAGAGSCQTKRVSDITLRSNAASSPTDLTDLSGSFAISDLTGCGAFNGLISPLAAGSGNTLALKVLSPNVDTPAPGA